MKLKIKTVISLFLAIAMVSGIAPWNKLNVPLTAHAQETSQSVAQNEDETKSSRQKNDEIPVAEAKKATDNNGSAFLFGYRQNSLGRFGESFGSLLESLLITPILLPVLLLFFVPLYIMGDAAQFLSSIGLLDKIPDDILIGITGSILEPPLTALVIYLTFMASLFEGPSAVKEFVRALLGKDADDSNVSVF